MKVETYNPYSKGRWYKIELESDSDNNIEVPSHDLDVTLHQGVLYFPKDFHLIDFKIDCTVKTITGADSHVFDFYVRANHRQGVSLPEGTLFTNLTVYAFGYYD